MSKQDEKRLKKDPRYQRITEAHATMTARIAAAQAEIESAKADFAAAVPDLAGERHWPIDARAFETLRPRGDMVRVIRSTRGEDVATTDHEVENVTPTQISLVGYDKPFRIDGKYRGGDWWTFYRIHENDLAHIQAGEVKGWRQKPWGMERDSDISKKGPTT